MFKLTVAFDGTAYHGWQGQRSGRGVQNHLEQALSRVFASAPKVISSSRTDAGVHARALVVHVAVPDQEFQMPVRHLPLAINAGLPETIRVMAAARVPANFHARFDAVAKQYRYLIWNRPVMDPLLLGRAWHVPQSLDLAAMRVAARELIGCHDFTAFTSNRGGILGNPCRTVTRCECRHASGLLTFVIEGDGFLYKMCRAMVGTLVEVGRGRIPATAIPELLASRDRRMAGANAPAHGLILWLVRYRRDRRLSRSNTGEI